MCCLFIDTKQLKIPVRINHFPFSLFQFDLSLFGISSLIWHNQQLSWKLNLGKDKCWIKSSYWSIYLEVWDFLGFLVCLSQSLHVSQIPEEKERSTDKILYMMYDMENLAKYMTIQFPGLQASLYFLYFR